MMHKPNYHHLEALARLMCIRMQDTATSQNRMPRARRALTKFFTTLWNSVPL